MLGRFLKKHLPEDQRVYYRRVPGKGAAIGVKLICANGRPVAGTLSDLSAGGAAVEFDGDLSGELELEGVRELVFSSLTASSFRAHAEVRSLPRPETPGRYGFMFLDPQDVFEQLDDAFYKFFNRRRFRRAKPALGERLHAEVAFGHTVEQVSVHDLSLAGAAIIVPADLAADFQVDTQVQLKIHVPKTEYAIDHYAIVRHVTPGPTGIRVGLSLEPCDEGGESKRQTRKARAALGDYIRRRLDEIDRYNSAF